MYTLGPIFAWGCLRKWLQSRPSLLLTLSMQIRQPCHHGMPSNYPSIPPCPEQNPVKSTSFVPWPAREDHSFGRDFPSRATHVATNRQVCKNLNEGKCSRQHCRFLHICNYCSGAHARAVCPVQKSVNKSANLSTPVNIFRLADELSHSWRIISSPRR